MDKLIDEFLEEHNVILKGHFQLTSGRHSDIYVEKANLYKHPYLVADLCWDMALWMATLHNNNNWFLAPRIDVVVGPSHGGIVLSHRVADDLREIYGEPVISLFTQKDQQGNQVFCRAWRGEVVGKNVLVVDDVLTTGGTLRSLVEYVTCLGGNVLAAAVICNRGGVKPEDIGGVPLYSLFNLELEDWPPEKCPLCSQGLPLTEN